MSTSFYVHITLSSIVLASWPSSKALRTACMSLSYSSPLPHLLTYVYKCTAFLCSPSLREPWDTRCIFYNPSQPLSLLGSLYLGQRRDYFCLIDCSLAFFSPASSLSQHFCLPPTIFVSFLVLQFPGSSSCISHIFNSTSAAWGTVVQLFTKA